MQHKQTESKALVERYFNVDFVETNAYIKNSINDNYIALRESILTRRTGEIRRPSNNSWFWIEITSYANRLFLVLRSTPLNY